MNYNVHLNLLFNVQMKVKEFDSIETEIIFYCNVADKYLDKLVNNISIDCNTYLDIYSHCYDKLRWLLSVKHNEIIVMNNISESCYNTLYSTIRSYLYYLSSEYYEKRENKYDYECEY